jgi:hypothetical protein
MHTFINIGQESTDPAPATLELLTNNPTAIRQSECIFLNRLEKEQNFMEFNSLLFIHSQISAATTGKFFRFQEWLRSRERI